MVEINLDPVPPSRESGRRMAVGNASGIDSEALTQSSIADPDDLAAPPIPGGNAFQSSQSPGNPGNPGNPGEPGDPGDPATGGNLDGSTADLPVDPSAVWQSESSRRTSQLALVVMLAIFGLVAATVGFIQFARSFTRIDAVAQNSTEPAAQPIADPSMAFEPQVAEPEQTQVQPPSEEPPPLPGENEIVTDTATEPPRASDNAATRPGAPDADSVAITPVPAVVGPAVVGPAITAPPLADEGSGAMDDLPVGLRKFVPLLDVSTADNGALQIFATPPTIDSVRLDAAAEMETEETPTVKRASIDIPKLLAMRFAIDNRGATLSELVLLVSQLTGVPIELELISIDLAGISVNQPLETPAGWMSMDQWLQQSLASAGLTLEIGDGVALVHASAQQLLNTGGQALVLDDFGDDAEQIAQWLQPIVIPLAGPAADLPGPDDQTESPPPADAAAKPLGDGADNGNGNGNDDANASEQWSFDAAEKRWIVPADRYLLVQSICAAEAMRLMRGKPTKLPRQQTARWIGRWTSAKQPDNSPSTITDWPVVTDGPSGTQLDSPRTIAGLLRRVATENRAAVAVVWNDAMRHQVYPTDLAMPLSDGLTVGAYLDELVGESGLQARDCGDSVWWIGSEGLYDRYEVITWMTIPVGTGEAIAKRLAVTVGVPDPSQLPIAWDESTLMIRAPRYIARQWQRFISP